MNFLKIKNAFLLDDFFWRPPNFVRNLIFQSTTQNFLIFLFFAFFGVCCFLIKKEKSAQPKGNIGEGQHLADPEPRKGPARQSASARSRRGRSLIGGSVASGRCGGLPPPRGRGEASSGGDAPAGACRRRRDGSAAPGDSAAGGGRRRGGKRARSERGTWGAAHGSACRRGTRD